MRIIACASQFFLFHLSFFLFFQKLRFLLELTYTSRTSYAPMDGTESSDSADEVEGVGILAGSLDKDAVGVEGVDAHLAGGVDDASFP